LINHKFKVEYVSPVFSCFARSKPELENAPMSRLPLLHNQSVQSYLLYILDDIVQNGIMNCPLTATLPLLLGKHH